MALKRSEELRQAREKVLVGIEQIMPKEGDLNDEQRKQIDLELGKAEAMLKDAIRFEKLESAQDEARQSAGTQSEPASAIAPKTKSGQELRRIPKSFGRLTAFEDNEEGRRAAYEAGRYLQATLITQSVSEYFPRLEGVRNEARRWIKEYGTESREAMVRSERRSADEQRDAMSGQINSAGAALVPETFSDVMIRLVETYGIVEKICRQDGFIWPMKSDTMRVPRRTGGLTSYFVGDTDQITTSKPTVDQVVLVAKKLAMLTLVPTSLLEDSPIDIAEFIAREMAWLEAKRKDDCAFNGTGTSTYGGIKGILASMGAAGKFTAAGHTSLGAVTAGDIAGVDALLPVAAEMRARWYCHKSTWANTFNRLAAATGGIRPDLLAQLKMQEYLTYPIEKVQAMTKYGSTEGTGAQIMFLGDLAQALVFGDRRELTIRQSDQRYFEYDQIGVLGTARFDIVAANVGNASEAGWLTSMVLA